MAIFYPMVWYLYSFLSDKIRRQGTKCWLLYTANYLLGGLVRTKKREVRLFLTLYKGFAIPQLVEKQPKSTPDMYNPPAHNTGEDLILHIHGTFIVAAWTSCECCEDSVESQTTSINASYYVTAFLRCRYQHSRFNVSGEDGIEHRYTRSHALCFCTQIGCKDNKKF